MNFTKAFTYIFEDRRWFEKLLTPLLVSLIPFIGWMVVAGYVQRVIRNVVDHQDEPLPELSFGDDLSRGFKVFLANLIFSIPIILIMAILILPLAFSGNDSNASVLVILFAFIAMFLSILYAILLAVLMPASNANLAIKGTLGAAFDFKTIFAMFKNNFKAWLLVLGGSLLCSAVIAPLGAIILVIGALITSLYSQLVVAHLSGQAYALSQTQGGQGAPLY